MTDDIVASSNGITGTPEHVAYVALKRKYEQHAALLAEAREALEAVEWVKKADYYDGTTWDECAWCGEYSPEHKLDCPRQAFLAKLVQP